MLRGAASKKALQRRGWGLVGAYQAGQLTTAGRHPATQKECFYSSCVPYLKKWGRTESGGPTVSSIVLAIHESDPTYHTLGVTPSVSFAVGGTLKFLLDRFTKLDLTCPRTLFQGHLVPLRLDERDALLPELRQHYMVRRAAAKAALDGWSLQELRIGDAVYCGYDSEMTDIAKAPTEPIPPVMAALPQWCFHFHQHEDELVRLCNLAYGRRCRAAFAFYLDEQRLHVMADESAEGEEEAAWREVILPYPLEATANSPEELRAILAGLLQDTAREQQRRLTQRE